MTVKCQNVVKCKLLYCIADIRCVKNFSECNNCAQALEQQREIKIARINLKSTFIFVYNAVDVGKVFTKTFQKFQKQIPGKQV